MKTICIITLHTVPNYGSCLQSYATQQVFQSLGWEATLVNYCRKVNQPLYRLDKAFEEGRAKRLAPIWRLLPDLAKRAASMGYASLRKRSEAPFLRFRKNNLLETKLYLNERQIEADPPIADVYCTGSDQVWNSIWNEGFEEPLYLTWAPEGKPRISFAASIGREELDEWEKPLMADVLKKYKAVSMREISGVRLLKELGIDNVELVLDPTLMLREEDWRKIATYPSTPDGGYVLSYQLNQSDRFAHYAQELGRRFGLPVVKVCYRKEHCQAGAVNLVAPEVTDFLGLFLKASCIVTDSFHATAFSLNFGKPFVSIAPNRFSTRIKSILELTNTEERLLNDFSNLGLMEHPIDFELASNRLDVARAGTMDFLRRALDVNRSQTRGAGDDDRERHGC